METKPMKRAYKFLARGALGPISNVRWPRPVAPSPGGWLDGGTPLVQCERGVHLARKEELAHWLHDELWLVEYDGAAEPGSDCLIVERARLLRRIEAWDEPMAMRFAVAARDHLVELAARAAPEAYDRVAAIIGDASRRVALGAMAMAAYNAAIGVARLSEDASAAYRRERIWQSQWIARELSLE
jgi:hypothetical protein